MDVRHRTHQTGLTLVEVLIVSLVVAFLTSAVMTLFLVSGATLQTGLTSTEVSETVRSGMMRMTKELRGATRTTVLIPDGTDIRFQVPGNPNTIRYELGGVNGRQLIRTEAATVTVLGNNIQDVQFSPSPFIGGVILITLQAQKTSKSRHDVAQTLSTHLKVRN